MSKIKMLSWNVNGIRAISKKGFIEWAKKDGPDILCLQETKAREEQLSDEIKSINDYSSHFVHAEKKGYSGVAVYTKVTPKKVSKGFGVKKFDSEGRVISFEFDKFILFNVYFPNGNASSERLKYKMDFYESFLKHIDSLKKKGKRIVVCGDVNTAHKEIDLARPKENEKNSGFLPQERAWIDKLVDHGYLDTLRIFNDKPKHYSWWDYKTRARERNVGWRIDYFFVSDNLKKNLKNAFILPDIMGSDHCPVGIEIEV